MDNTTDRVRVLFADQLNLPRGKYLPPAFAAKGQARFCAGAYAVTYARDLIFAPGANADKGLPDIEAVFNPDQLRPGWESNTKLALVQLEQDGAPYELCGRSALINAISRWQKHGLNPMIGLEGEAYIFQRGDDGAWVPYDTPGAFVYGTGPFTDPHGLIDMIWDVAQRIGIEVESFNSEFDSPQFELTLGYKDALKACDDFFLFRTMAREILYKKGFLLSFMPKPIENLAGNGLHINLSFSDNAGENVFAGHTKKGQLSPLVSGCIAGLLKHHEAMAALLAPTVNSYQRLKPGSLSGYWANWGHDHRGVAVRVSGEGGKASRIEHRVGDCAASPYVAVSSVLNAALLGYENGYALTPEEGGDGITSVDTERHIPESLDQALKLLVDDKVLTAAIGQPLIDNYVAVKEAEINELAGKDFNETFEYYAHFL